MRLVRIVPNSLVCERLYFWHL